MVHDFTFDDLFEPGRDDYGGVTNPSFKLDGPSSLLVPHGVKLAEGVVLAVERESGVPESTINAYFLGFTAHQLADECPDGMHGDRYVFMLTRRQLEEIAQFAAEAVEALDR